jgi:BlaI family penicillinase repressor
MLPHLHLSRRESQVMDLLYQLGESGVSDVVSRMPDDPGYNTIRNTLSILERKGWVTHRVEGRRYIYAPVHKGAAAERSAIRHMVQTFFHGSLPRTVLAMLGAQSQSLTRKDLDEIARYIEDARRKAR